MNGAAVATGGQGNIAAMRIGSTVTRLPDGCSTAYVNGTAYYCYGGAYYQPAYVNGDWQYTVASPVGLVVYELPAGATATAVGGVSYYTLDGVYYRASYVNGQVGYVEVASPQ